MNDSRLQDVVNRLDDGQYGIAVDLIREIASERSASSTPQDFENLEKALICIEAGCFTSAVSYVQAADSENYEGVSMKGVGG